MLADAVRQGLIIANPAARADLPPAQDFTGKEIPPAHTDAIRCALLELAPLDPLRRKPDLFFVCLFDVALGTGLRLGELRALRWRDVDRERRLIRVERAYSRQQLRRPKTESGVRSVPLFPSVEAAFRELAARAVERGRYAPDELVFGSMRGTPLQPSNFRQRVGTRRCDSPGSQTRATASTTSGTPACHASSPRALTSSSSRPSPAMPTRSSPSSVIPISSTLARHRGGRAISSGALGYGIGIVAQATVKSNRRRRVTPS